MSHSNLSLLSDDELLNHAHNAANSLTTTDLETEVLKRFEDGNNFSRYFDILEGFDSPDALQSVLNSAERMKEIFKQFDIKDSDDLEEALQSLEDARALLTTTKA